MQKLARIVLVLAGLVMGQVAWSQAARFVGAWQLDGGVPNRQRGIVISHDGDNLRVRFGLMQPEPKLGPAEATLATDGTLTIKSGVGTVVVLTVADDRTLVGRLILPNGRESAARATRMSDELAASLTSPRVAPMTTAPVAPPPSIEYLSKADVEAVATGKKWKLHRATDGQDVVWDLREGDDLYARNLTTNSGDAGSWSVNDKGELCVKWRGNSTNVCVVVAKDGGAYKTYNVAQPGTPLHALSVENLAIASSMAVAAAQTGPLRADTPTVKVGDRWRVETRDRRTGVKESESIRTVTAVTASQIEGTENNGKFVATVELNSLETPTVIQSGDVKYLSFPLEVGKKWDFKYNVANKDTGGTARWQLDAEVVAYEKVRVPAGEFDTFKIEYKGFFNNNSTGRNGRLQMTSWYAPATRSVVKREFDDTFYRTVSELMEFQLQP